MEILKVSEVGYEAAAKRSAEVLAGGGLIVYPTDTLYGIGVDARNLASVARLRALKARDEKKPVSILVGSIDRMRAYGAMNQAALDLAYRFLPGALTLVVPAKPPVPREITQDGSIGIRIPDDAFTRALGAAYEYPVTATSANIAGMATPATVPELILHFGPRIAEVDLFIDDGPRIGKLPSTVVRVTDRALSVLREGALSKEELGLS